MNKAELRAHMKAALADQTPEDRREKSRVIAEKLLALEAFRKSATVCFYSSLPAEVDTRGPIGRALADGKHVLVPLTDLKKKALRLYEIKGLADLVTGAMGIPEPDPHRTRAASVDEAGCFIVPGLCFDRRNHRLGYGAGLYDRFLQSIPRTAAKVGLAFAFQVLDEIPAEPHDVSLDLVLTEDAS